MIRKLKRAMAAEKLRKSGNKRIFHKDNKGKGKSLFSMLWKNNVKYRGAA